MFFRKSTCFVATACVFASAMAQAATFRVVARSGDAAPGTAPGTTFVGLGRPSIDALGRVSMHGQLTGPGITFANGEGIWSEAGGTLSLATRRGQPAPGTPAGVNFAALDELVPNGSAMANLQFYSRVTGPGVTAANNFGIWSGAAGAPGLIARNGSQAPGVPVGVNYSGMGDSVANAAGAVAFSASLSGPGTNSTNNLGHWYGPPGGAMLLARHGAQAPGTLPGSFFDLSGSHLVLNSAGTAAFAAGLSGPGVAPGSGTGIWTGAPGSLSLTVRAADPAPGLPGVTFANFQNPTINSAGDLAFHAARSGPGIDPLTDSSIWSGLPGSLTQRVAVGDAAPGGGAGVTYEFLDQPVLGGNGDLALTAMIQGPGVTPSNARGLWRVSAGGIDLVARAGDGAPGTPGGVTFDQFVDAPLINTLGQVAFTGSLTGAGVDATNAKGIWAFDPGSTLRLIARNGDPLELAPGDVRTVLDLIMLQGTGAQDGRATSLADNGDLAFTAIFTDGSSAVLVTRVPEPGCAALLLLASLFRRGRRFRP